MPSICEGQSPQRVETAVLTVSLCVLSGGIRKQVLFKMKDVMENYDPRAIERSDWTQAKEIGGKEVTKKKLPREGGGQRQPTQDQIYVDTPLTPPHSSAI